MVKTQCSMLLKLTRRFSTSVQRKISSKTPYLRQEILDVEQRTVGHELQFAGNGLHSGQLCRVVVKPAPADTGLVFRCPFRNVSVAASWQNVLDTSWSTVLACPSAVLFGLQQQKFGVFLQRFGAVALGKWLTGCSFATVEHLLAALSAANVDNAVIELSHGEVPVMDGSSLPFTARLGEFSAVRAIPGSKVKAFRVLQRVQVSSNDGRVVSIEPFSPSPSERDDLEIAVSVDFGERIQEGAGGLQHFMFRVEDFAQEVASARTFCFFEDIEKLRSMNLALGGSLSNAVVYKDGRVVNAEGLRYADEAARHKALDALGDLRLGGRLIGRYVGVKPGHALNQRLLAKLFSPLG